jgi:cation:H+ antiporter
MLSFAGTIFGIVLLIGGGTLLVRGASEIAEGYGVSPMVVGLTIVGFGTSSPELVVNIVGALQGATDIAFGNVVGSNISNLGLVLGATAIMCPMTMHSAVVRRELPLLLLATTMMAVMALDGLLEGGVSVISRTDAIVLGLMFLIFVYATVLDFLNTREDDPLLVEISGSSVFGGSTKSRLRWLLVIAGFVLLMIGGELTVRSGIGLAAQLGVSATVIGLFVVAVGTSMPELVTSIIAALRDEPDLALGNVIGSNIFNLLVVLPASGIISQIPVPPGGVGDVVFSWVLAALLIPVFFLGKASLGRPAGVMLLLAYAGYAGWRIVAG